jgi:transcriptional regulator with XRE-family HTH domain
VDVEARSGVSRSTINRIELGDAPGTAIATYDRVAAALGASATIVVRWRGSDADQLTHAAHGAMHVRIGALFAQLKEWIALPEVTFSIFGERGAVDWLAWHPATRSLLVVEIKTAFIDVQAVLAQVDRYLRLAGRLAADQGWQPATISLWLVFEDSSSNRRAVAAHRTLLVTRFGATGRALRRWLSDPNGPIFALSFLAVSRGTGRRPRRVRLRATEAARRKHDAELAVGFVRL